MIKPHFTTFDSPLCICNMNNRGGKKSLKFCFSFISPLEHSLLQRGNHFISNWHCHKGKPFCKQLLIDAESNLTRFPSHVNKLSRYYAVILLLMGRAHNSALPHKTHNLVISLLIFFHILPFEYPAITK